MFTRRNLITLAVTDAVLFLIANVTSKSHNHPGAVSNVAWVVFVIGLLLLIVLGVIALIQSWRRGRATTAGS